MMLHGQQKVKSDAAVKEVESLIRKLALSPNMSKDELVVGVLRALHVDEDKLEELEIEVKFANGKKIEVEREYEKSKGNKNKGKQGKKNKIERNDDDDDDDDD